MRIQSPSSNLAFRPAPVAPVRTSFRQDPEGEEWGRPGIPDDTWIGVAKIVGGTVAGAGLAAGLAASANCFRPAYVVVGAVGGLMLGFVVSAEELAGRGD